MKISVTHDDGTTIDITQGVQVAYDIAYHSMNWGSGFLDLEEMEYVAHLAEACRFPDFEAALREVQDLRKEQERRQEEQDRAAVAQRRREEEREKTRASWQDPKGLPIYHGIIVGRP